MEGGDWALGLSRLTRDNLRWFWYDGLFSAFSDNIVLTYLNLYILALGGTPAQIGLMTSLSSLASALVLLPAAIYVEKYGHRKQLTVISGGIGARAVLLLMAIMPFFIQGPLLIGVAITLVVGRNIGAYVGYPGWMAMTGDMVPIQGRGRYFANRNVAMVIASILITYTAGEIITRFASPYGYQIAMGLAFLLGAVSTYSFAQIKDPRGDGPIDSGARFNLRSLLKDLVEDRNILRYNLLMAGWNFSLNIAGPFFSLYWVEDLHATGTEVAIITIASSVSSLLASRRIGILNDRWGPRKLQMISGLIIPIVPWAWIFTTNAWQGVPINLLGGALWAAYSLAALNYLLQMAPPEKMARHAALNQVIVTAALAVGAAVGGPIASQFGYHAVFILSGAGRLIFALLFMGLIK